MQCSELLQWLQASRCNIWTCCMSRALRLHVIVELAKDLQERQGPGATTSEAGRLQQHQLLLLCLLACLLDRAYGLLLQANLRRPSPLER